MQRSILTFTLGLAALAPAAAHAAPSALSVVSSLDLECRRIAPSPAPADDLFIRQLNPVIAGELPNQLAHLGPAQEVCVPVVKNGNVPEPEVRALAQWVDVTCYEAEADPVQVEVDLSHLNPELADLPDESVDLVALEQVCVPVRKNFTDDIPDAVLEFVEHFDLACYGFAEPTDPANFSVSLSHLNPVIRALGFVNPRMVELRRAHQLCVPIAKNQEVVPEGVRSIIEWADFLKFNLRAVDGEAPPIFLTLSHLNPLFAGLPAFQRWLFPQARLMVPVAKNGVNPPD